MNRIEEIVEQYAGHQRVLFIERFAFFDRRCESPIESLMLAGFMMVTSPNELGMFVSPTTRKYTFPDDPGHSFTNTIDIFMQAKIGNWRADFLLLATDAEHKRFAVAVECDGHDFHDRTKAQAKRDRARDRAFQELDIGIARFTGSEIHADPEECAQSAMSLLETKIYGAFRRFSDG